MAKNISKKVSSSVVSSSSNVSVRSSSVFTAYPTMSVELDALTRAYQAMGKQIESLHSEIRMQELREFAAFEINQIAKLAWAAYHNTEMHIPYNDQTRSQAMNINTAMLTQTDSMPDRIVTVNKITPKDRPRLSVNQKSSNNELVTQTIIANDGVSFKNLPLDAQVKFDSNTKDMYNKLIPFFHTMKRGTGSGKFAILRNHFGRNLTEEKLQELKTPDVIEIVNGIATITKQGGVTINGTNYKADVSSIRYMSLAVNNF